MSYQGGAYQTGAHARTYKQSTPPLSGTSGSLAGRAQLGDLLVDTTYGIVFVNEGSVASPYWTPIGYDQAHLWGAHTDWRDQVGVAVAGAAGSVVLAGSGVRVFGQGADENDSGLPIQAAGEGGSVARMTTTDEIGHLLALGLDAGVMQPDQHQLLVLDVELTMVSAITARSLFVGFLGTAADALDEPVTIATTTATLVQDDMAGLAMDTGASDGDALFGVHNKSNAAATQDLTADGDTGPTNVAAAATYQRFRVEIGPTGTAVPMRCFVDKVQVYTTADALDEDEECTPVVYLGAQGAAVKEADVRRFATWAYRP